MSNLIGQAKRVARRLLRNRVSGHVDVMDGRVIRGWAVNPGNAEIPARIVVILDGAVMAEKTANMERQDVAQSGLGPLKCGFEISVPLAINDGRAHRMEVRRGIGGPLLRGGTFDIAAGDGANAQAVEGVAQFDARIAAIRGWAAGADRVLLSFDTAPAIEVPLLDEVPGFGPGGARGFAYRVPRDLRDGQTHVAHVSAGGTALDGAPVSFQIVAARPVLDVVQVDESEIVFQAHRDGRNLDASEVSGWVDGAEAPLTETLAGLRLAIPPTASTVAIAGAGGEALARFEMTADGLREPVQSGGMLPPPDDLLASASAAFAAFLAAPDDRFDAAWYSWAQTDLTGQSTPAEALHHYAEIGAAAGASPNPMFNETEARDRNPGVAAAIGAGTLPCAFAMELVSPDRIPDPRSEQARPAAPSQSRQAATLPEPTRSLRPDQLIYSAWTSRLALSDKQRAMLAADEDLMRRDIQSRPLTGRLPLVSIIMPSWNRAFTIGEAIQSALDQSYANWELLISDDASDDRTAEVVRSFNDPRIRYMKFLKSNGAGARNKGLRHAKGDLIAYLDSDNIWHPQFLDMMVRELAYSPGSAIAFAAYLDTEIVGAAVKLREVSRPSFRPIRLSSKNFMDLNTIVHRRKLYDWLGGFDGVLPRLQDWDLVLRYTSIFRPLAVDRIGVFYRRNVAWGQVTHIHHGSGAQDIVGEKTHRRLTEAHEKLAIQWPVRPSVTVLGGPGAGVDQMARGLAERLESFAQVDVLLASGDDALPEVLWSDPHAFGQALAPVLSGRVVIDADAGRADWLQSVPGLDASRTLCVTTDAGRVALRGLSDAASVHDLGAIPLTGILPTGHDASGAYLVISPAGHEKMTEELVRAAGSANADVLVCEEDDTWYVLTGAGRTDLTTAQAFDRLGALRIASSLCPVSTLSPLHLSLLAQCQASGVPIAVPKDPGPIGDIGLGSEWIAARAAYEVARIQPPWLLDKAVKLVRDTAAIDRLVERGHLVHSITLHPDLVRERLAESIYALQFAEGRS